MGHDLAIAELGSLSGLQTTLVRSNGPAISSPLIRADYVRGDAAREILALAPDQWTAIIAASHDDEADDEVLECALRSDAAYVGVLGSAARIPSRAARLSAAGVPRDRIAALHAPIGVVRCGKAPWEVAVSTVAEIMQVRASRSDKRLHDGNTSPRALAS